MTNASEVASEPRRFPPLLQSALVFLTARPSPDDVTHILAPSPAVSLLFRHFFVLHPFQELEAHLHSEINSLGYPKAALFGFCVALVTYNVLAVVKAALRRVHGEQKVA